MAGEDEFHDDNPPPPPPPVPPTQQAPHTLSTIKLPILKKGEYDIWAMKMEHYLGHTDYPIWEVIQKGNGPVQVSTDTNGQIRVLPPKTAEEILARERERKARTTLLMSIPEDHLAKFYKMTDAKETGKLYKKSPIPDLAFQSLLSQLEIHGAGVSTEDANQKFLRSLPTSWSQVSLIMRTKPGVDSLSFDDLYNNLRVFEPDVKGSTGSSTSAQNVAFVSSSTSRHFARESGSKGNQEGRRRDTGYNVKDNGRRPRKQEEPKALVTLDGDGVDWTGHAEDEQEHLFLDGLQQFRLDTEMSAKDKSGLGYGDQIHEGVLSYENEVLESVFDSRSSDVEDSHVYDRLHKVEGMHAVPPPMTGIYMPPKSNFGIDESNFTYGPKQSKTSESAANTSDSVSCESNSSVETLESVPKPAVNEPKAVSKPKVWSDAPIIEDMKSDIDENMETVKEQNTCSPSPKADKRDWNGLMSKKLGLGYGFTKKACFVCGSFSHLIRDCDFHEKRMAKQVELNKQKVSAVGARWKLAVKAAAALKNKGIVDSGCSRHMTGNKAYLVEYQDYNGARLRWRKGNVNSGKAIQQYRMAKIQQTPSSNSKNKVEAHPRNVKSSLNKRNGTVKGSASVQNSKKHDNSDYVCISGDDCMSSDNLCVFNSMNDVKFCAKPKKKKSKKERNACPLTRITTTNEVPSRKPIVLESESPKPVVNLVYSRKPRKNKNTESVSKTKVIKPISANKQEPSKSWDPQKPMFIYFLLMNAVVYIIDLCQNSEMSKIAKIMGYRNNRLGMLLSSYYGEGLGIILFSVGQFCDFPISKWPFVTTQASSHLEVYDLLKGSRGINLYTYSLE
ncbi:hypothetical protein Tco_1175949 [Tanacetum coccineum]